MRLALCILLFSTQSIAFDGGDPLFDELWHLVNTGQVHREEITDIKSVARPGIEGKDLGWRAVAKSLKFDKADRPKVAIVDSGIDYEHEDLAHAILLNEVECDENDIPIDEAKEDRDDNGYKGDCKGINLVTRDKLYKNRPLDDEIGHGTHLAGIISAKWNNGLGVVGIHEDIQLLPIKAISDNESKQRRPLNDRIAEAINYAVSRNVDVINLSLGYPIARDTENMRKAVTDARNAGVFIVAAAGNNAHGVPVYPCAYESVICVGSVRNDGKRSEFSNYGAHVDVYAPGEFILSTFPMVATPQFSAIKGYETKSGTSQAAPMVAAGLAILKKLYPTESLAEIERRLFRSLDSNRVFRLDTAVLGSKQPRDYRFKFKDFSVAHLNSELAVQIPIQIQNLKAEEQSFNVDVPELSIANMNFNLDPFETKKISLDYQASGLDRSHALKLNIEINQNLEQLEVCLARSFSDLSATEVFPIENTIEAKSFGSVTYLNGKSSGKYFVEVVRNKEPRGMKLKLWQKQKQKTKVAFAGEKVLEGTVNVMAVYQADVNADSIEDLLVVGLGVQDGENTLRIHYLTKNLQPLFTDSGFIEKSGVTYFIFSNFIEPKRTRWIYNKTPSGESILVPVIVDSGYLAPEDQSLKQRRRGGAPRANHIYTLKLSEEDGKLVFNTRVVDNAQWVKAIRKKYRLRYYENVEPTMVIGDQPQFLVRIGQLEKSRYLLVSYDGSQWKETLLNWPRGVLGLRPIQLFDENSGQTSTALFGLISKSRAELVLLNSENLNDISEQVLIDLPDESEHIVRPLLVSYSSDVLKVVFEAGQKLFGFEVQDSRIQRSYSKVLPRTTFFGEFLTQVNAIVQDKVGRPWIYVDDTQVNVNSMRLQSFSAENGFQTKLRDSYSIEKNCKPLNPARYSLHILCRTEQGLELRSLPMQVNTH